MISGLLQLIGFKANAATSVPVHPRQIDLSGNVFQFSMPENFSKDMPAADMVEQLDIKDIKKFDDPEYGNIIRRWWDIKRPGFFGKDIGIVMMDMSVQRVPDNQQKILHGKPYDISNRLDFLMMIYDQLHQTYDQLNEETQSNYEGINAYEYGCCHLIGDDIRSHYRDYTYNNQKWIGYSVSAPNSQLIVGFVMPLTADVYLELVFTYSPNHNILPNEFLRIADETTQPIEDSLYVNFAPQNPFKTLVEDEWINTTNTDILMMHKEEILVPLFGPDIRQQLEESKRKAIELMEEINQSD
ncbi:MAG: hypothetical protein WCY88_17355 [Spongiibacteraceae bacterium]